MLTSLTMSLIRLYGSERDAGFLTAHYPQASRRLNSGQMMTIALYRQYPAIWQSLSGDASQPAKAPDAPVG
ncbi:hypothetical protein BFX80_01550 [Cobetia marina]|nr:hypothetical protein BFX80_01550 [Cobetia marina]POR05756.1 hypothetical protein BOH68_12440 [Cobetia sp. MM1IDA2H-1]